MKQILSQTKSQNNKKRTIIKLIAFLAVLMLVVGCHREEGTATVRVHLSGFTVEQEEFPELRSAVDPASYNPVTAVMLAFYDIEGTEVYKTTQYKNNGSTYTTFGSFTANLPVGTYTMVALGYAYNDGDVFTLTSPTEAAFTSERPREMFCATQSVMVTSGTSLDLNVTLNRIVSALKILSTDGRPASATKVRTTYAKGGKSFNPTTGLALTDNGFTQTNNPSSAVGATIQVTSFPFLYTDEETMDITIEVLDANNNLLFTHTVNDVPFKRNRMTTLQGDIFTANPSGAGFLLETSWLTALDPIDF